MLTRTLDRGALIFLGALIAIGILVPLSNLLLPAGSIFQVPTYLVALFGKYACYAILALANVRDRISGRQQRLSKFVRPLRISREWNTQHPGMALARLQIERIPVLYGPLQMRLL